MKKLTKTTPEPINKDDQDYQFLFKVNKSSLIYFLVKLDLDLIKSRRYFRRMNNFFLQKEYIQVEST